MGILEGLVAMLGLVVGDAGCARSGLDTDTRMPVPTKNLDRLDEGAGPSPISGWVFGFGRLGADFGDAAAARRGDGERFRRTGAGDSSLEGVVDRLPNEDFLGLGRGMPKMLKFFLAGCFTSGVAGVCSSLTEGMGMRDGAARFRGVTLVGVTVLAVFVVAAERGLECRSCGGLCGLFGSG
jgi:hypothetical protein